MSLNLLFFHHMVSSGNLLCAPSTLKTLHFILHPPTLFTVPSPCDVHVDVNTFIFSRLLQMLRGKGSYIIQYIIGYMFSTFPQYCPISATDNVLWLGRLTRFWCFPFFSINFPFCSYLPIKLILLSYLYSLFHLANTFDNIFKCYNILPFI